MQMNLIKKKKQQIKSAYTGQRNVWSDSLSLRLGKSSWVLFSDCVVFKVNIVTLRCLKGKSCNLFWKEGETIQLPTGWQGRAHEEA